MSFKDLLRRIIITLKLNDSGLRERRAAGRARGRSWCLLKRAAAAARGRSSRGSAGPGYEIILALTAASQMLVLLASLTFKILIASLQLGYVARI